MEKKHIDIERLRKLEKSIGFLSKYVTPDNQIHHIGPNINTVNVTETKLLHELGEINKRRNSIIEQLTKIK
jgi:hypothetical protein